MGQWMDQQVKALAKYARTYTEEENSLPHKFVLRPPCVDHGMCTPTHACAHTIKINVTNSKVFKSCESLPKLYKELLKLSK